jgi:hypothetical protein
MTEHKGQFDDLDRQISDRLRQDLRSLFEPPGIVPPKTDKAILDEARRRIAKPRRIIIRLRWATRIAAAAAVIAVAAVLYDVSIHPNPKSEIANLKSIGPVLAEGRADIDGNGRVDILDAFRLARSIEARGPANPQWDLNGDGRVDRDDVDLVASVAVRLEPRPQPHRGDATPSEHVRVAASSAAWGWLPTSISAIPKASGFEAATRFDTSDSALRRIWDVVDLLRSPLGKGV